MAKYEEMTSESSKQFEDVIEKVELDRYVSIKILSTKLKSPLVYKVQKANDLIKFETGKDAYVFVNEEIFNKLSDEQKRIVAEEAISGFNYNFEKDRLEIKQGDVTTFSLLLKKFGADKYLELQELIKMLYSQETAEA